MTTSDIRITDLKPLGPPRSFLESQPITPQIAKIVTETRTAIENIENGTDSRMMMLVGPCSIPSALLNMLVKGHAASSTAYQFWESQVQEHLCQNA